MNAAAERLEFAPPATPGLLRALLLAILAHGLLVAALTWGVRWKHETQVISAEAELWAAVPQEAAPKLQAPEPEPLPPEESKPVSKPVPESAPVVEPPKVDITLEQEKRRLLKQKQLELDKQQEKLNAEKVKQEKLKAEKLLKDKLQQDKLKADKQKQDLADKTKQAQDKKLAEQQTKQLEAQREKNLQRMTGLAGASGGPGATGTAQNAAGPSANYAGRIRARIKPNIVFTEDISGNPSAEVEVRTSADGTIIARKLLTSSGDKSWDDAVLKAIDKTEILPRDTDGRVPATLVIRFRPKD